MCGICGFTGNDLHLLKLMASAIHHRGPDQDGFFEDKEISLASKRLAIIDLSERGCQPAHNEDESINVVYNGEIYNFQELRSSLERQGHRFYSGADTEVIAHAYEEYGEKCVDLFNGMFAFALWDAREKKLFIARDALGIKPLYYFFKDGLLVFGSEIKCILQHPAVEKKLDEHALSQLISNFYAVDDSTLFQGIKQLMPGTALSLKDSRMELKKFWHLSEAPAIECSETECVQKLGTLLSTSVESMLVSDVPIGATLSGGLDSSTIVALMSKKAKEVKTFTAGFDEEGDEFTYAQRVAEHCGTKHTEIHIPLTSISQSIPQLLWHLESIPVRTAVFPTFFFSREIRKHVTVALIGEGADELFAGYERMQPFAAPASSHALRQPLDFLSENYFKKNYSVFSSDLAAKASNQKTVANAAAPFFKENGGGSTPQNALNKALLYELSYQLPQVQLQRIDKLTMASSIEARVPYLDNNVVKFSMSLPPELKVKNGVQKYVLKKVAASLLPREIIARKKLGLATPFHTWFEKDFASIAPQLLSESKLSKFPGVFNSPAVKKLLEKRERWRKIHSLASAPLKLLSGKTELASRNRYIGQIWFLAMTELFLRVFFEEEKTSPPKSLDYYLS